MKPHIPSLSLLRIIRHRSPLSWRRIALPMLLALLMISCSEDDGPITPPIDTGIAEVEARVQLLINQHRADKGLAPLTLSDVITTQARQHSR